MKELYNAPEVEIVRFAPAMAIAADDDIGISGGGENGGIDLEGGGPLA